MRPQTKRGRQKADMTEMQENQKRSIYLFYFFLKRFSQNGMFGVQEQEGGEQFAAVKPWLGALVAPTHGKLFYKVFS